MEAWPSNVFPNPTVGFAGDVSSAVVRTQMESGRTRQRQRFTRQTGNYKVTWELNDVQYGMFQSFVKHKLHSGADNFQIDLPIGGEGLVTVEAKFVDGKYSGSNQGVLNWVVTATLEVDELPVWDEDIYDLLVELDGALLELEEEAARLHTYVTT